MNESNQPKEKKKVGVPFFYFLKHNKINVCDINFIKSNVCLAPKFFSLKRGGSKHLEEMLDIHY